jgi:hypothetical protein
MGDTASKILHCDSGNPASSAEYLKAQLKDNGEFKKGF